MKKLSILLITIFIFGLSTIGNVSAENVLFEGIFERGNTTLERAISSKGSGHKENGKPVTHFANFLGSSGEATLKVCNGVEAKKISSAIISINGNVVLGSSTFNQNVGCINKMVNLNDGDNKLEVQLKSKPGGKVSIEISQPDSPPSCDGCDDTDGYPNVVIDFDPVQEGNQGIPVGDGPSGVSVTPDGAFVYVTNYYDNTVSVIDTSNNTVIDFDPIQDDIQGISVGNGPSGVSVTPDGAFVYVTNHDEDTVSVIDTSNNTVIDFDPVQDDIQGISVGNGPSGVSVTPDGAFVYVANYYDNTVSVIDTSNNTVIDFDPVQDDIQGIPVGSYPFGVSVTPDGPDGMFAYVTNYYDHTVSVIDTSNNTVIDFDPVQDGIQGIPVGSYPFGISMTPDGKYAYVNNLGDNTVSVIDTSNNTEIDFDLDELGIQRIPVGSWPYSGIAVSPDGKFVYVGNYGDDTVSVIGF